MYVKLPSGDLNPDLYLLHLISTYTCRMTTAQKVSGGFALHF